MQVTNAVSPSCKVGRLAMVWPVRTDDRGDHFLEGRKGGHMLEWHAHTPHVQLHSCQCDAQLAGHSQPHMLSWQQMESLGVHLEELHDLPQLCGIREQRSLGDWSHLRRQ